MRNPIKRLKLYEMMKADIASGIYSPGMFLPNEFELAEKYGYSRGTVRSALAILENDKLLERLAGKGRRICQNSANSKVPLTFLLPCPGFASLASSDIAVQISSQLLEGVTRVAFECDYKVETVPVSPSNDAHDIDWRKLDFVNANSMLIVNSPWFRDLFPLFLERRCRTVFIYSHIVQRKGDEDFMRHSFCIIINILKSV